MTIFNDVNLSNSECISWSANACPLGGTVTASNYGGLIGSLSYFSNANGDSYLNSKWLKCDGSIYSQATYSSLFSRLGLLNPGGSFWSLRTGVTSVNLSTVASSGSNYIAAGTAVYETSTNAFTWSTMYPPNAGLTVPKSTYGTKYVIGGGSNPTIIMTSTDGISLSTKTPTIGSNGNMLILGTVFVAAGTTGILSTSSDGVTWTGQVTNFTGGITALTYTTGTYMFAGVGGYLATSTNASSWQQQASATASSINALVYGATFVLGTNNGGICTSTNGSAWTEQTSGTSSSIVSLTYGNSLYLYGGVGGVLATSTNGVTWTARTSNTTSTIFTLTYGTVYVLGANGGKVCSSTDAITWTSRTSNTSSTIYNIIYANSLYVASGQGGAIITSTDATTWTARTSNITQDIFGMTYTSGLYYAGTNQGVFITSTDAITWVTTTQSGTISAIAALAYGNGLYVFGAAGGGISTSTDAITWTQRTSGTASQIDALVYGSGPAVYVATGNGGVIASSTDATTWTIRTSFTTSNIVALAYGTIFVAAGSTYVATSTDGTTWVPQTVGGSQNTWNALTYSSGIYVLGGSSGVIYTSTNALNWTQTSSSTTNAIQALAAGQDFIAGGAAGTIVAASATYSYNTSTQFQVPTDAGAAITYESTANYQRSLYIRALS